MEDAHRLRDVQRGVPLGLAPRGFRGRMSSLVAKWASYFPAQNDPVRGALALPAKQNTAGVDRR